MKKDKLARRLQHLRTTVRSLSNDQLGAVAGGGYTGAYTYAQVANEEPIICVPGYTRVSL
jgi:hypothetical protein